MRKSFPIFLAFLAMGFLDAVGSFVGLAKDQFHLSNVEAQFIAFSGFVMFGLLSVPMGLLQARWGKKQTLTLALAIMLAGLLVPTLLGLHSYGAFIGTILLLGAGGAVLQVAGNPIMRDVSPDGLYARNLTLGQFIKAIGSLSGPAIPWIAANAFGAGWQVIFPIYAVAVVATLIAVSMLKVKETRSDSTPSMGSCLALLGNPRIAMFVMAIFCYVGAEVCLSSGIPLFLKERFAMDVSKMGLAGTGIFFMALTIGRFSGSLALNFLKPATFLIITCALSILGLVGLAAPSKVVALASFVVMGLGFANIFPLVFSLAVDAFPTKANEISGLMVTAIVGGAFLPPVMGFVTDRSSALVGFSVPLAAILYVTIVALSNLSAAKKAPVAETAGV